MEIEHEHGMVFLNARGNQSDVDVLTVIQSGISHSRLRGELTDEQIELAKSIDHALKNKDGELFSLSGDEARLAAEAIERHIDLERRNMGRLINDATVHADEALPLIIKVAQTAQT
jgi:hypothetical protein